MSPSLRRGWPRRAWACGNPSGCGVGVCWDGDCDGALGRGGCSWRGLATPLPSLHPAQRIPGHSPSPLGVPGAPFFPPGVPSGGAHPLSWILSLPEHECIRSAHPFCHQERGQQRNSLSRGPLVSHRLPRTFYCAFPPVLKSSQMDFDRAASTILSLFSWHDGEKSLSMPLNHCPSSS